MKKKSMKRIVAFILTLSFLLSFSIVAAFAAEDKTSTVYIDADSSTGDITEEVGNITVSNDYGAEVYAEEGATATLTSGNVDSYYGVYVGSYGNGSTSNMTINGDATNGEYGIYTDAESGSETNVNVTGSVTNAEYGLYPYYTEYSATTNVNIGGDVTSDYYGIYGDYVYDNSTLNIDIAGDLKSKYDDAIYLKYIEYGSKANINIGGDVVSEEDYGIYFNEVNTDSELNINIGGDLIGAGEAVHMHVYGGSTFNLDVAGSVIATDDGKAIDICSLDDGSAFNANIGKNIEGYYGIYVRDLYSNSNASINVKGDIVAEDCGLWSDLDDADCSMDLLVEGTISGSRPIVLDKSSDYTASGTKVTAWKIVPNSDGIVAGYMDYTSDAFVGDTDFEKTIKYIIKLEQPEEGATLSATKADGSALEKSHDLGIAYEGDKVLLKVDLQEGYKILAAYNGDGEKVKLLKDSEGNYYVEVPKGGGVYLSVELDREDCDIIFDLDGGTLDGQTGKYTYHGKYGDKITLGEPTKDGCRFLYWRGSTYYAGDTYTILEDHTLTAVWEEITEDDTTDETPAETPDSTPDTTPGVTPDEEGEVIADTDFAESVNSAGGYSNLIAGFFGLIMSLAAAYIVFVHSRRDTYVPKHGRK